MSTKMPPTSSKDLMSIATDKNLRIHERIKLIKASDDNKEKISSVAEAKAILAIPKEDLTRLIDNEWDFSSVRIEANDYLKKHYKKIEERQEARKKSNVFEKTAAAINTIGKYAEAVGEFLSFVDKISKRYPIYY